MMTYCEICGKPIDDDDDNVTDTDGMGYVHDKCLAEWRDDAPGRAADFYFDTAGDR